MEQIIWRNDDYQEWHDIVTEYDGFTEEEASCENYYLYRGEDLDDERGNLDIEVGGCIVTFAVLGLWDGRHNGGRSVGTNVKNILHTECDEVKWYCDRYNVRCVASHHDGTNTYLYRVAKDKEEAERLINKIAYGGMTEEQFRKRTRSLRPYVAKVYGW